ncbi:MAG: class I tRNA ligase family protein [Candidatus Spechtbacterales bacterium]
MDFNKLENRILENWKRIGAFEKSVSGRPKKRQFIFYEGPPTANGRPGLHHVLARSFKDIVCRYKTMRGFRVERRAGWDTHGLPVELEVEKALGLKNKKDIEKYGVARFNEKCRQSVWKYKSDWEFLTERMGFWIDMKDPYITYDPLYMETLWWVIKNAWENNLLYEGHKVTPRCTRCGTGLSSHEVAQGYKDIVEESVFVKFRVKNPSSYNFKAKTYLLAWTTTPWTLPGNVALAVGSKITYVIAKQGNEYYILAKDLLSVLNGKYELVKEISGKELSAMNIEYEPLFDSLKDVDSVNKHIVVNADFVSTEDGTGIVHTAVMYGEDDYKLAEKFDLPKIHTVDENGLFTDRVKDFKGQFVKNAETGIIDYLKTKDLLYKSSPYKHSYPFCWRCGTPLLYYAMQSWFVRMGDLKKTLLAANEKINWFPEYIKQGRFGEWLRDVKDWAFSRSRYWGTPLPIWKCAECAHTEVIGSRADIAKMTKSANKYYFLRHGMSERNVKNILASRYPEKGLKYGLIPKGINDIRRATKELKKLGGVDIIVASPLTRTRQTAEIVAKELGKKVIYDQRLVDVSVGIFEGHSEKDYLGIFSSTEERFTKAPPKGENLISVQARMLKVANELENKYKNKKILIISHGDPLWLLESALLGLTTKEAFARRSKNYPLVGRLRKIKYSKFPYNKFGELDFHRPYIDAINFPCTACNSENGVMRRVEDLADVWFDSGAMPFAQAHYPFENKRNLEKGKIYPADYIAEAVDQTRGWFYTMLAVSAVLGKAPSYKNVISLGHVLDERGQKMSKSKGNIVDPFYLAEKYGMDSVRWYFFTVNGPGFVKRFSEKDVRERMQKFISTLYNSLVFLKTYAPKQKAPKLINKINSKHILDKWILLRLRELGEKTAGNMDAYNVLDAARGLDNFVVEDLSNWYIRRSRERLQRPEDKNSLKDAAGTLAFVLGETSKMSASFIPFLSEHIWQEVNADDSKSVHWEKFPVYKKLSKAEKSALDKMELVRELAGTGLKLRAENSIKVRQPLESFAVPKGMEKQYQVLLKEELNVREIVLSPNIKNKKDWAYEKTNAGNTALKTVLSPDLVLEGQVREIIRHIQKLRKSLGLKPDKKIIVHYSLPEQLRGTLYKMESRIISDTNTSKIMEYSLDGKKYDATAEFPWAAEDYGRGNMKIGIIKK